MAYASISEESYKNDIVCKINNLTYQASSYGSIIFKLYKYTGSWTLIDTAYRQGSEFGSIYYAYNIFTQQEPGAYYATRIWINYGGTWYLDDPGYGYGYHTGFNDGGSNGDLTDNSFYQCPAFPAPTISGESTTYNSITFTSTVPFGSRSTYFYASSSSPSTGFQWYNINDIKGVSVYYPSGNYGLFDFTTSGNQITFTGLYPWQSYFFLSYTVFNGWSSASAGNNGNSYLTYTTPALTTINTPTITASYIDGFDLSWYNAPEYDKYYIKASDGFNEYFSSSTTNTGSIGGLSEKVTYYLYIRQYYVDYANSNWYGNDYGSYTTATTLQRTPSVPYNFSITQPAGSLSVDLYYSWGSYATSIDIRWSTDQSNWTYYYSQSNNYYPSANYNIGVGSTGNKYFQIRSRRTVSGTDTYSSWVNANYYPINIQNRPTNFTWTNTPGQGNTINLKASDINTLKTKINEFRVYKGYGNYSFNFTASVGSDIAASHVNDLIDAMSALQSYFNGYSLQGYKTVGGTIYANDFLNLSNCLNSIN